MPSVIQVHYPSNYKIPRFSLILNVAERRSMWRALEVFGEGMELKNIMVQRPADRMPDVVFRLMNLIMGIIDFRSKRIDERVKAFGIKEGSTVVDYGCGPGRYTMRFSKMVGDRGKVYAIDIHELAIAAIRRKIDKFDLENVEPILAREYSTTLPDHTADIVCVLDTFFMIKEPSEFLREIKRITAKGGVLVIDDGHQPRALTKRKLLASGMWRIEEETRDHLKCKPLES